MVSIRCFEPYHGKRHALLIDCRPVLGLDVLIRPSLKLQSLGEDDGSSAI